ncbi:integrin-linked protein kinase-like [Sycon ciliatum]|uniref:integrin-linked protein kinase-like n=1 Tax=Sycon ciliatum TaxID=27933 RepID=UPI0020AA2B6C|eukprot:scpid59881/ scgid26342/ Integrin-linked protein kinase
MDDIFFATRDGNEKYVREWLSNNENDINETDGHGFTPLHWAVRQGQASFLDLYLARGARVDLVNMGGDTPMHLAAAHGNPAIVKKLLQQRASINAINEHGNTPLHYACFWNHASIAQELVVRGARVMQCNKYDQTTLELAKKELASTLADMAQKSGQEMKRIEFRRDINTNTMKHPKISTAALHERGPEVPLSDLNLIQKMISSPFGEIWRGMWQGVPIVAKKLTVKKLQNPTDFLSEFPHLRIFSHTNVMPVLGAVCDPMNLITVTQYMDFGSLDDVLHNEKAGVSIDFSQSVTMAKHIAQGMSFLHSLDSPIARLDLCPTHVMVDTDLIARINLGCVRFSFQDNTKVYRPQYKSPEALQHRPDEINFRAADMWSFAIVFCEMVSRKKPFAGLTPLEVGMKVALENKRPDIPDTVPSTVSRFINILWNREPSKRPSFDKIVPIIDKMH